MIRIAAWVAAALIASVLWAMATTAFINAANGGGWHI